jgi:hypothetical protein
VESISNQDPSQVNNGFTYTNGLNNDLNSAPNSSASTTKARMSNNREDKDMSGFSFEAVQTKKSAWQMFKALVYVRNLL